MTTMQGVSDDGEKSHLAPPVDEENEPTYLMKCPQMLLWLSAPGGGASLVAHVEPLQPVEEFGAYDIHRARLPFPDSGSVINLNWPCARGPNVDSIDRAGPTSSRP